MSSASFLQVLDRELELIRHRRRTLGQAATPDAAPQTADADIPAAVRKAQQTSTFGVAFSGGGIRSATFNLGVLQGLAEKGLLTSIDYLSTVSGGGYIGCWFHGIVRRGRTAGPTPTAPEQMDHAKALLLQGVNREPGPPATDPITFLRKYSNYLAPRPGLFSADTWTIGFIWLRNVLLNQLILVPAIAAAVVATLLVIFLYQLPLGTYRPELGLDVVATIVALACLLVAAVNIARNLRPIARQSVNPARVPMTASEQRAARGTVTVPLVFGAMVALGSAHFEVQQTRWPMVVFWILMAFIQITGGFVDCYVARRKPSPTAERPDPGAEPSTWGRWRIVTTLRALWNVAWMSGVSGGLGAILTTLAWKVLPDEVWVRLAVGPPLIGLCFIAAVMLLVGLMGAEYPDAAREWTARTGSMLGILMAAWIVWFGLAVFGPWKIAQGIGNYQKSGLAGAVIWVMTTLGGVLAGRSPRTANGTDSRRGSRILETLASVAPTIFLLGYLVAIATGVHALMPYEPIASTEAADKTTPADRALVSVDAPRASGVDLKITPDGDGPLREALAPFRTFARRYPSVVKLKAEQTTALPTLEVEDWTQFDWTFVLLFSTLVAAVVASRRININEFSLHHFYKNRLVRCYLGASQAATRKPHPLTGFDPLDDFPIEKLHAEANYFGPYPIINAALNLNAGSELATQERKAASFVFTPAYCGFNPPTTPAAEGRSGVEPHSDGFDVNGYRETKGYAYPPGPDIGTAVAISGAAANPNWGHHTSGPMAFLLTVFNARLGWWLGNPRWRDASRDPGPKFALRYLFSELLGQTTGTSQFVNLSDGGHFDNLGLYELVRRRTRFIIVCDAEEDHALSFGSLGGAIRKCRADFGVEIDINPDPIRLKSNGFSAAHCVVGTILYSDRETAFSAGLTGGINAVNGSRSRGWLLYLKSSLTGDEPADVTQYRAQYPEFPHQSTADQFFSESQFESYRRLGYHILRSAFEGVVLPPAVSPPPAPGLSDRYPLVPLFQGLTRKWYAPIPVPAEAASRLALAYVTLMNSLASTPALHDLHRELVTGKKVHDELPQGDLDSVETAAGMEVMQLVQNVYTEFDFENAFNRANPRNSGWMSVFRKWRQSPLLYRRIWPAIQNDYHPLFRRFVDDLESEVDVPERP